MKYLLARSFLQDIKRLKKKYPSVEQDVYDALNDFSPDHEISLGKGLFKIRVASRDLRKGKSGGFRAHLYLKKTQDILVPLSLHAKSERGSLSEAEIISLLRAAQMEFFQKEQT